MRLQVKLLYIQQHVPELQPDVQAAIEQSCGNTYYLLLRMYFATYNRPLRMTMTWGNDGQEANGRLTDASQLDEENDWSVCSPPFLLLPRW